MPAEDHRHPEDLDQALAASAPAVVSISDDLIEDMDHVAAMARTQVVAERPRSRRLPRLLTVLGIVALLLGGGVGAAVASGGFTWLPWAEDAEVAYAFTLPSGRACEERVDLRRTWFGGDWDSFVASARELTIVDAEVSRLVAEIRNPNSIIQTLNAAGQLQDPPRGTVPTDDDWHMAARHVALKQELSRLAQTAGLGDSWDSDWQLQCEAVAP